MSELLKIQTTTEIEYERAHAEYHMNVINQLFIGSFTLFLAGFLLGIAFVIFGYKFYAESSFGVSMIAMFITIIILKISEFYSTKLEAYNELTKGQLLELYESVDPYPDLKKALAAYLKRGFVIRKESWRLRDAVYDLNYSATKQGIEDNWSEKLVELNRLSETE